MTKFNFSRRTREVSGPLRCIPALLAVAALLALASCPNPAAACAPKASAPGAPRGLQIARHFFDQKNPDRQTVELSWTAPDPGKKNAAGPAAPTAYTVYWAEGASVDKTSALKQGITPESAGAVPATTLRLAGFTLDAGKVYTFIVTASDGDLESGGSTAAQKPALDFAVKDLKGEIQDGTKPNVVTASWTALTNNPVLKAYKVYFKRGSETVRSSQVAQGTGTISRSENLPDGAYSIEVTVVRTDDTESRPVRFAGPVTVDGVSVVYKDDAALKAYNGNFSLGDFDGARLFKAVGLSDHANQTIKRKVLVKEGSTVRHDGKLQNLIVDSNGDSAFFGISEMSYGSWAAIADDSNVTISIELAEPGGTVIASETLTKKKTPDGDIHTWRDLQNMKHKLDGNFELQNNIAFPAKNTEGFESFAPVGTSVSRFTGKLDGKGKTVTGFYVSQTGNDAGLFGGMGSGGEIKHLRMLDPYVKGDAYVGVFVGTMAGTASLLRVEASREEGVMVEGTGRSVGGLVGHVETGAAGVIVGAASGEVAGGRSFFVGGLVGYSWAAVTVAGTASGAVSGRTVIGGLVGAYPTGADKVAGYWDKEATGQDASAGGGIVISKTDNVTYRYGRYFDGDVEVFNDAEWHKHFRLPRESGKWPRLAMDSSTPPAAPTLKVIKPTDVTTLNKRNTITLSWDAPATAGKKADGSDATISKYTVYWRAEGGQTGILTVTDAAAGTVDVANLDEKKSHIFTLTATSNGGLESLHSVEQQNSPDVHILYKRDASLVAHSDKFSLGDFDSNRLFKLVGFVDYASSTIKRKVTVTAGHDVKHTGAAVDLDVDGRGEAHFGIGGMSFGTWAGITDNTTVTITVELTASAGTPIKTQTLTRKKTPDGDIHTWWDLRNMKHRLDGSYTLRNDIGFPAAGSEGLAAGKRYNFVPVGNYPAAFSGSLDGNGKTITGLYIRGEKDLGLFGYISAAAKGTEVVANLTLDKPDVQGASNAIGSVAGRLKKGSIIGVTAKDVDVGGTLMGATNAGGLVGFVNRDGVLEGNLLSGSVRGLAYVGGLAGDNSGTVRGSAAGKIFASRTFHSQMSWGFPAGGLVGHNRGTVMGLSSAEVTADSRVGGLVGENEGSVWGIFTGKVTTNFGGAAGGLVGQNNQGEAKVYGAALGSVSAGGTNSAAVGGLVGANQNGAEVRGWSTATVNGHEKIGGMVGSNAENDKVQGYALGYVGAVSTTKVGAVLGENENIATGSTVVFAGRNQAEETANDATPGSGDHVGVISATPRFGVQRTTNDFHTVVVESAIAPTLPGLGYGTQAGEWKTETGKRWPVLIFPSDFPGGQPVQDPKIPDKPANFYE